MTKVSVAENDRCGQVLDGERQGDDTVTTVDGLQRVGICACGSEVLPVEIVALALADAVRERDVIGRVDGNRLRGDIAATVCIRTRDAVVARAADGYGRVAGRIAPRIRARARGRERNVIALTETVVAADAHIR